MSKFKVGDIVRVLGCTENVDWLLYISEGYDHDDNMDSYVGKDLEVVAVDTFYGEGRDTYLLSGCKYLWIDQWLAYADQLPGQMSIEDFGLVVDT